MSVGLGRFKIYTGINVDGGALSLLIIEFKDYGEMERGTYFLPLPPNMVKVTGCSE